MVYCFFCFFKQKTAYEMRISDWSSDVCSSDLALREYSEISGRQILFATELVKGRRSTSVRGRMSSDRALSRLLAGSGLLPEIVDGALILRAGTGDAVDNGSTESGADGAIVVTGSCIRGAGPTGSPVVRYVLEEIGSMARAQD